MRIKNDHFTITDLILEYISFKSFSDYDFWQSEYDQIKIENYNCKYRLEDCFGIPGANIVKLGNTKIKSLKGISESNVKYLKITESNLENLKYLPSNVVSLGVMANPLLSYYNTENVADYDFIYFNIAGMCLAQIGYTTNNVPSKENFKDMSFNAKAFCEFKNANVDRQTFSNYNTFNPWQQCYHDPNEVDNFEFLFLPFWKESEIFRQKANEYLEDVNLSRVTRNKEELW